MEIHITARKIDLTDSLREHVESKVSRLSRYLGEAASAQVTLSVEKYRQIAEIILHAKGAGLFQSRLQAQDLYAAVDGCADRLSAQLKRHKERMKDHRRIPTRKDTPDASDISEEEILHEVTRVERVDIQPMTLTQAISAMEEAKYNFWLFRHLPQRRLSLIYRREDGTYGLMEIRGGK